MTEFSKRSARAGALLLIGASFALTACASKPDRRGPPQDRGKSDRPARTSGTFMLPAGILFASMDQDGDKVISGAELAAGTRTEWAQFSQSPSAIQFSNWSVRTLGSTDAQPTFMSFDQDFNGVITEAEFSERLKSEFERLDKDGNGRVERAEMTVAFEAPIGRGGQGGQRGGGQEGGKGRGGGGRPPR